MGRLGFLVLSGIFDWTASTGAHPLFNFMPGKAFWVETLSWVKQAHGTDLNGSMIVFMVKGKQHSQYFQADVILIHIILSHTHSYFTMRSGLVAFQTCPIPISVGCWLLCSDPIQSTVNLQFYHVVSIYSCVFLKLFFLVTKINRKSWAVSSSLDSSYQIVQSSKHDVGVSINGGTLKSSI